MRTDILIASLKVLSRRRGSGARRRRDGFVKSARFQPRWARIIPHPRPSPRTIGGIKTGAEITIASNGSAVCAATSKWTRWGQLVAFASMRVERLIREVLRLLHQLHHLN